ncbi:hypothetical protein HMPREF3038_01508, partial [Akkermansia sp. KLE1797]
MRGLKPGGGLAGPGRGRRTLTGAWIETCVLSTTILPLVVAPSRVRGLKRVLRGPTDTVSCRTLTGAWIETTAGPWEEMENSSHPHG